MHLQQQHRTAFVRCQLHFALLLAPSRTALCTFRFAQDLTQQVFIANHCIIPGTAVLTVSTHELQIIDSLPRRVLIISRIDIALADVRTYELRTTKTPHIQRQHLKNPQHTVITYKRIRSRVQNDSSPHLCQRKRAVHADQLVLRVVIRGSKERQYKRVWHHKR